MTLTLNNWLQAFSSSLARRDAAAAANLFVEDCYWRDLVAFTWDIQTLEGRTAIGAMLEATPDAFAACAWSLESTAQPDASEGVITFETAHGRGGGYVRLRDGKCWTLLTALTELTGHEERRGTRRSLGHQPDPAHPNRHWQESITLEAQELGRTTQPFVLIVGGGQGGLGLAARLRQLDVPTIIVDRYPRVGDQWRSRYDSLSLHDPVWYDHMPYLPFPDTWPVFMPKDKLADWLEAYARIMEVNIWSETEFRSAQYDDVSNTWVVDLVRGDEPISVRPSHLVIATGNAGTPNLPAFDGADSFAGTMIHSSQFRTSDQIIGPVVVIGSNNSAQDICADLAKAGIDVAMIQRSSTHIIHSKTFVDLMMGSYSEAAVAAGMTTERADLIGASMPLRLAPAIHKPLNDIVAQTDADYYQRLEAAGFMLDFGEDGTGMALKYLRTASGYYIDVGAADLIIDGSIKLRSRVGVARIERDGIVLTDGDTVPANTIIFATGFSSMHQWVARTLSDDVAAKIGRVWGYGSGTAGDPGPWEGELRNMWKPTQQQGLWFHGGNLAQARFYSRFLALQLKARHAKLDIHPYRAAGAPAA